MHEVFSGKIRVPDRKQNLPQLYRFCFLMLGDSHKAQEVFHTTLREAALGAAQGQLPKEPFWLFREARWLRRQTQRCDRKNRGDADSHNWPELKAALPRASQLTAAARNLPPCAIPPTRSCRIAA